MDSNNTPDPFEDRQENQNLHHLEDNSLETEIDNQMTVPATNTPFEHENGHHEAGKRDVELYIRTYNTLLRSSGEVSLKALKLDRLIRICLHSSTVYCAYLPRLSIVNWSC